MKIYPCAILFNLVSNCRMAQEEFSKPIKSLAHLIYYAGYIFGQKLSAIIFTRLNHTAFQCRQKRNTTTNSLLVFAVISAEGIKVKCSKSWAKFLFTKYWQESLAFYALLWPETKNRFQIGLQKNSHSNFEFAVSWPHLIK